MQQCKYVTCINIYIYIYQIMKFKNIFNELRIALIYICMFYILRIKYETITQSS